MKASKALADALKLFGKDGKHWVNHVPTGANQQCSVTAINIITYNVSMLTNKRALKYLKKAAKTRAKKSDSSEVVSIVRWNDKSTWPKVKAAFNQAIKLAKAKGD
jgi:hypothetical protein